MNEGIRGVVVQRDGRIVAAGETQGDVGLTRYRSGGHLDRTFGSHGVVITQVSPSTDEVAGLKLQPDGRLVVAGTAAIAPASGREPFPGFPPGTVNASHSAVDLRKLLRACRDSNPKPSDP